MKKNWTMKYMLIKIPFKSKKRKRRRKMKQREREQLPWRFSQGRKKIPREREKRIRNWKNKRPVVERRVGGHTVVNKRADQERGRKVSVLDFVFQQT